MFFVNRSATSFSSADSVSWPNQDAQATNHPPDHKADSIAEDFGTWMAFELGLVVEILHFWVTKGVVPGTEEFTLHPLVEVGAELGQAEAFAAGRAGYGDIAGDISFVCCGR